MKREKSLIGLSHDHHHGLKLAKLLQKNAPIYKNLPNDINEKLNYALSFYHEELLPHFNKEENILFPFIKNKDKLLDELIDNLIKEHDEIKKTLLFLNHSKEKSGSLDYLGKLLQEHIRKEERILFPKIQEVFNEKELNILEKLFLGNNQ